MSRRHLEKSGYLKSFPHLLGCVSALHGSEDEIRAAADRFETGDDWTASLAAADLVLSPAARYPVYPLASSRNPIPLCGLRFDRCEDRARRRPRDARFGRACLHRRVHAGSSMIRPTAQVLFISTEVGSSQGAGYTREPLPNVRKRSMIETKQFYQ
jgi:hypothetical protein